MCDERERLIDYLYSESGAEERRRVEQHLESCETCREEIRGLRGTREDLLAWDVPDRGSVWKPFAPPRALPVWRDVPRWALAAAASVMFLIGAAGGFATRAFFPAAAAGPVLQTASRTTADPQMSAQQIRDLVRAELDQRAVPVSMTAAPSSASSRLSDDELMTRIRQMIATSELRQGQQLDTSLQGIRTSFLSDLTTLQKGNSWAIKALADKVQSQGEQLKQWGATPGR